MGNTIEWVLCPVCKGKTRLKVKETTVIKDLPLFCPKCKQTSNVDIIKYKLSQSR